MTVIAFECYADQDVYLFLRDSLKLKIQGRHSYSQGEVIRDLLVKGRANIGIVDEDPGASHHRARDAMALVEATQDIELRRQDDRHLFILKPALELAWPDSRHANHKQFREELTRLHEASVTRRIDTFVSDLGRLLGAILG